MGSFLLNCGISNGALCEGTPVHLFFISKFVVNSDGSITSNKFGTSTWTVENLMIEGIQDDYGYVNVSEESKDKMILIMKALFDQSVESPTYNSSHPSWKEYCTNEILSWDMCYNEAQVHFNRLLNILHTSGVAFKDSVQQTTSLMHVSHVTSSVIDVIKETPFEDEEFGLKYDGAYDFNRTVFNGYDDYIDFLIFNRLKYIDQISHFSTWNNALAGSSLYFTLIKESHIFDLGAVDFTRELVFDKNEIINKMISIMQCRILVNYFSQFGIELSPSIYVGQDYSDTRGKNYRRVMEAIFYETRQQSLLREFDYLYQNSDIGTGEETEHELHSLREEWINSKNSCRENASFMSSDMVMHPTLDGYELISKYHQQYPK